MSRKLYVHLGTAKTGTTSIQWWLTRNRQKLMARGILYPQIEHRGDDDPNFNLAQHILAFHWGQGWTEYPKDITTEAWENFYAQAAAWQGDVVISSETFALVVARHAAELFGDIFKRLPNFEIIPILYLRDHITLFKSDSFEFLRNFNSGKTIFEHVTMMPQYLADLTNYRNICENIRKSPHVSQSHIRAFDQSRFFGGKLIHDFSQLIEIDDPDYFDQIQPENSYADTNAMRILLETIGALPFLDARAVKDIAYKAAQDLPDTSGPYHWPQPLWEFLAARAQEDIEYLDATLDSPFFQSIPPAAEKFYIPGRAEDEIARQTYVARIGHEPSSANYRTILEELATREMLARHPEVPPLKAKVPASAKRIGKVETPPDRNVIVLFDEDGDEQEVQEIPGMYLVFNGTGSVLRIHRHAQIRRSNALVGPQSRLTIERTHAWGIGLSIDMQGPSTNRSVKVGKGTSIGSARFSMGNECNAAVEIGERCMFSTDLFFLPTDGHTIFDIEDRKVMNRTQPIVIGNHVWIGANAFITKGSVVADDTVIGVGSVVAGKFTETHTAIAGNSARVVRRNVNWDRRFIDSFSENDFVVK